MRKIGKDVENLVQRLAGNDEQARINLRANQVRARYKQAIEAVYRDNAALFLAHTNNVYIMKKNGVRTLIVYVDESIFAAELNAQRELIKLHLLELFGEDIEQFDIHISRGKYKKNHPYLTETAEKAERADVNTPLPPLDDDEKSFIDDTVSKVSDTQVRESLRKAMTADLRWKKAEKRDKS